MKEQLNNITRELEEIKNKELTQQEKKENEQLYKKELKKAIKETIEQETETQLQQGETIKDIYNYLIVNDDTIKDNITRELLNYKKEVKREIAQAEYQDPKKNIKKYKVLINYPFKDFDIFEDIDNLYYTILKNVINKYTLKSNIKKEELKKELSETFLETFKKYGYTKGKLFLYDEIIKNSFINKVAEDKEEEEHLKNIYLKTLKETEKNYLLMYPQPKATRQTTTQKKYKTPFRKTILIGSLIHGTIKGLYKASK